MSTVRIDEVPDASAEFESRNEPMPSLSLADIGPGAQAGTPTDSKPPVEETPVETPLEARYEDAAKALGLDVAELGSDAVRGMVDNAEKLAFKRFQELNFNQQNVPQNAQLPTPPWDQQPRNDAGQWQQGQAPPQQMPANQGEQTPELPEFNIKLDPEDYGEDIVKAFSGVQDHMKQMQEFYQGKLDNMNQILENQQREVQERADREVFTWFDKKVNELGDESVFGNGPIDKLFQGSPQFAKRQELFSKYEQALDFLGHGYGTHEDAMRLAMESITGSSIQKKQELSKTVRQRSKQTIGKPSGRKRSAGSSFEDEVDAMSGHPARIMDATERRLARYAEANS